MSNSPIIWDEGQKARMLNQGPLQLFNGTEVWEYAGNPNTNVTAAKGSLVLDRTNGKIYINTDGATAYRDVEAVPDHNSTGNLDTGDYLHFTAAEKSAVGGHLISTSNPHNVTKTQVGLGNVPDVDATNPANITQSASYRFVTDTEKGIWNGKQVNYATVAAAEAATPTEPAICYIQEKKAVYAYCASCSFAADGDLILNTGNGGTTRWEMVQKMSRTQGDTGWINTGGGALSSTSTTTVRLATSSTGSYAVKSIRVAVPINNYDITLSGAAGPKFIYFDDATLTLKSQDTLFDFNTQVPVSVTYWDGTKIVASPQTEYHGIRDTVWHSWAHRFLGLQYVSGLSFTGSVQTDNNTNPGADDSVFYLWSTSGVVQDEDVQSNPGTGQWAQTLGSGLTSTTAGIFPFFYFNGTAITTNAAMADRAPFIHAGNGTPPQWNNGGALTASVTGDYIVYHYFVTPMTGGWALFSRPHNAKYASLALALAASPTQLTWSNYAEVKHIYTAVFRVNTGWSNNHLCKLVSLRDFRLVAANPSTAVAPTAHSSLSALELAAAGVTWGHIDDQTQTIAGIKIFSTGLGVGTVTPATELHVASTSTSSPRGIMSSQHNTGTDGARIHGRKSRGTNASPTAVASGDTLARWVASGYDGTNYLEMASIDMIATGTVASTRVPTAIAFSTATDAAPSVLTERMRIANDGTITMPNISKQSLGDNINAATAKDTPVDADMFGLMDSGASNILKKFSWAKNKAAMKSYMDTLYISSTGLTSGSTPSAGKIGEVVVATDRTISAVTTGGTTSASPLATLEAGNYLCVLRVLPTPASGNTAHSLVLTNSNATVGYSSAIYIYHNSYAVFNGGRFLAMVEPLYLTAQTPIYATSTAYGQNSNVTVTGYFLRFS